MISPVHIHPNLDNSYLTHVSYSLVKMTVLTM